MEGRSSVYGACYWIRVHAVRVRSRKIRNAVFNHTPKRSENFFLRVGKLRKASFQENLLQLSIVEPYRKPTQVCRASRPRRTGETSLRNSAKKRPYLLDKAFPNPERKRR